MFRVLSECKLDDGDWEMNPYSQSTLLLPKKDIKEVLCLTIDQYAYRLREQYNKWGEGYPTELYSNLELLYYGEEFKCRCNTMGEYYHCKCDLSDKFPLYVVDFETKGCFFIHPDEREHMRRFIAGEDNPMYEISQLLKFNFDIGLDPDLQKAKKKRILDETPQGDSSKKIKIKN